MKETIAATSAVIIAAVFFTAVPAGALDLGASLSGEYGKSIHKEKKHKGPHHGDGRGGTGWIGVNIVGDTILDKKDFLNLRISLGYRNGMTHGGHKRIDFFSPHSLHGILWTNTLGLGIVKKENFRFWIGPQLGMALDIRKGGSGKPIPGLPFPGPGSKGHHTALFGNVGLAAGINYSPVKNFYLTADLGARYAVGGTLGKNSRTLQRVEPFVNLGFLYRVGGEKAAKQ